MKEYPHHRNVLSLNKTSNVIWIILGIVTEILFTLAALCALFFTWLTWWTGVEAEHTQVETLKSVAWVNPVKNNNEARIAQAQFSDPPAATKPSHDGDLIAQVFIPRFGNQWERNIVQGSDLVQINKHGLGHYSQTQLPGEKGNFAVAGHRNGYGQPLSDVDQLQKGDPIILRTKDYWYVYRYTGYEIVKPEEVEVLLPTPQKRSSQITGRFITMTTCEPKYSDPVSRWISYGELQYWAKVSDGVPQELTQKDSTGKIKFINNQRHSLVSNIASLAPVVFVALAMYVVIFIAAAIVWRWPALRGRKERKAQGITKDQWGIYPAIMRIQPGVLPIRLLLLGLLMVAIVAALFQWGFPWAGQHIEFLRLASNYASV